ncbi:MAG TPA: AlpA family phage regulatory protein [Verrucomicrobiae bacterium]|nr:AlpA family phage regulatory protein [Verrucomicrobiae bacterium]
MTTSPNTLLRRREVQARTGLSRSAIYADKGFPRAVRIGARAVAWVESEVNRWIEARIAASRDETQGRS